MAVLPGTFYRNEKEYLSVSEASHRAGLHPFDIYDAIKAGELDVIEVAGCQAVPAEQVEKLKGAK